MVKLKTDGPADVLGRLGATDRLIDVRSVAELLGVSDRTCWKMLYRGRLPACVRVNRSVRWRLSDIQHFIAGGCDMTKLGSETVKPLEAVR